MVLTQIDRLLRPAATNASGEGTIFYSCRNRWGDV